MTHTHTDTNGEEDEAERRQTGAEGKRGKKRDEN